MKSIKIFITGGTIDKVYDPYIGNLSYNNSIIPSLMQSTRISIPYTTEIILLKDSLNMNLIDRELVRDACISCIEDTIIVVHGTDTMVETARLLESIKEKTIILTGSIIPASVIDSDALFNISSSIAYSQILSNGIYIVMNGIAFNSNNVRKNVKQQVFENIYS